MAEVDLCYRLRQLIVIDGTKVNKMDSRSGAQSLLALSINK